MLVSTIGRRGGFCSEHARHGLENNVKAARSFSAQDFITRYSLHCRMMRKMRFSSIGGSQQQVAAYEAEHGNVFGSSATSSSEPQSHSFLCEYVPMQVYLFSCCCKRGKPNGLQSQLGRTVRDIQISRSYGA